MGRSAPGSRWWGVGIGLLGALSYANTLPNDFAYDDEVVVVHSERIRSLSNWREIWLEDWWQVDKQSYSDRHGDRLYRPLPVFTYALNFALSSNPNELHAFDFHLVNVVLHGIASGLVWVLVRRLHAVMLSAGSGEWIAVAAGLLFAAHPIHADAVASVVGRADVLAGAAVIGGLACSLSDRARPRWSTRLATGGLLGAALLSKESGIILLPWIAICDYWLPRPSNGPDEARQRRMGLVKRYAVLAVVFAVYVVLRGIACKWALLQTSGTGALDNPLTDATLTERVWTPFKILSVYLGLIVWPATLSADYSFNAIPLADTPFDPLALAGIAIVLLAVIVVARGWRRRTPAALAVLLFAGSYLMFANGPKLLGTFIAERLFYVPSLPVCWLAAQLLVRVGRAWTSQPAGQPLRRWVCAGALAVVVAALAVRTIVRNRDWRTTNTLFWAALDAYPESARVQGGIGKQLVREGRAAEALEYLKRAIRIFPNSASVYNDLGLVYEALGELEDAEQAAAVAASMSPGNPMFHRNLAHIRKLRGVNSPFAPERSLDELLAAAEQNPDDFQTHYQLGLAQIQAGELPKAVEALERALAIDPDHVDARLDYAIQLFATERQAEGFEQFKKVLDLDPDNWRAHTNMAVCLAIGGDFDGALRHAEKARDLAPNQFQTWINLAQVHAHADRFDEAMALYRRIRSGLPEKGANRAIVEGCIEELHRRRRQAGR